MTTADPDRYVPSVRPVERNTSISPAECPTCGTPVTGWSMEAGIVATVPYEAPGGADVHVFVPPGGEIPKDASLLTPAPHLDEYRLEPCHHIVRRDLISVRTEIVWPDLKQVPTEVLERELARRA
jgi:hypothetical protein